MVDITASMVRVLRERTGAGMMECKNALVESKGDMEAAIEEMRKKGQAKAAKRAGRIAAEGAIIIKVSADKKKAVMTENNSETDFVARHEDFTSFANNLAERALFENATSVETVLSLSSSTSGGKTIEQVRAELVSKIGENIQLRRIASLEAPGIVGSYLHGDRIGVLVAIDTTNEALARDLAMHIAASNPQAIDESDIDPALIAKERKIFAAQAQESGKPKEVIDKMVDGRIKKFIKEVCLVEQGFVKNPDQTVASLLKANNTKVLAFVRFEVGEGIEKGEVDFAAEVKAQVQGS